MRERGWRFEEYSRRVSDEAINREPPEPEPEPLAAITVEVAVAAPVEEPTVRATDAERRNGWDDMTLSRYTKERDRAAQEKIDPHSAMNVRNRRPDRRSGPRWNFPAKRAWQR